MRLIANRGNTEKKKPYYENKLDYISVCLDLGYDCKLDVWWHKDGWWVGNNAPRYEIGSNILELDTIWCQAKNIEALERMIENGYMQCFWISTWFDADNVAMASNKILWTTNYDIANSTKNAIYYYDEIEVDAIPENAYGICCDNIKEIKEKVLDVSLPRFNMNEAKSFDDILPADFFDRLRD